MFKTPLMRPLLFLLFAAVSFSPAVSAPWALLLGLAFGNIFGSPFKTAPWVKKILQLSIVGLGFGIDFHSALAAGSRGFVFSVSTIGFVLLTGLVLAKIFKTDKILSQLIAAGTAICGGSAIAAMAPVLKADHRQISVALGIVFLLNAMALFLFPPLGHYFGLSQSQFGIWSAIAIHDTSSVVGAASRYGEEALQVATTVKLARALWIIPLVLLFSVTHRSEGKIEFPYFILFFLAAIIAGTYLPFMEAFGKAVSGISRNLLKVALFFIGTGMSFNQLKTIGPRPLMLGVLLWISVSALSLYAVLQFLD